MHKQEKLKLIMQALKQMGYHESYKQLQQDSNIALDPIYIESIRTTIVNEDEEAFEQLINTYVESELKTQCVRLILEYKYIALLSTKAIQQAVDLLKNKLLHYCVDDNQKHYYASLVIAPKLPNKSKQQLVDEILALCHKELGLLEPNRLETILIQACTNQVLDCQNHANIHYHSLFQTHRCKHELPQKSIGILGDVRGNINLLEYSPDGQYLGIVYDSNNLIIMTLDISTSITFSKKHLIEKVHDKDKDTRITSIVFSPCSKYIASTGSDKNIVIIQVLDNKRLYTLKGHTEYVNHLAWVETHPNQKNKCDRYELYSISNDGWLYHWCQGLRKGGLKVEEKLIRIFIHNNNIILISRSKISMYDLPTNNLLYQVTKEDYIVSADVNTDFTLLLLNVSKNYPRLELYYVNKFTFIKQFTGYQQKHHEFACKFGWYNNMLISVGSENGNLYQWHIQKGDQPIITTTINDTIVNCVAYHPTYPNLLIASSGSSISVYSDISQMFQPKAAPKEQQQQPQHGFAAIISMLTTINRARSQDSQIMQQEQSSDEEF